MFRYLVFCLFILLLSCSKNKETILSAPVNCAPVNGRITYKNSIRRLINIHCNLPQCHSSEGEADIKYPSYDEVARTARNGTMKFRISLPVHDPLYMPKDHELDSCDLYLLKTWIDQGFPEE